MGYPAIPSPLLFPSEELQPEAYAGKPVSPGRDLLPVLQPGLVKLRHVRLGARSTVSTPDPTDVEVLLNWWAPQERRGVNGDGGFVAGSVEPVLNDSAKTTVLFPNAAGSDGILHRRRFDFFTDPDYGAGDEWVEVYWAGSPDPIAVFTPTDGELTRSRAQLEGGDGFATLAKVRETAAGDWHHAPRDVMEHYLGTWVPRDIADMSADPVAEFGYALVGGTGTWNESDGTYTLDTAGASIAMLRSNWGYYVGRGPLDPDPTWEFARMAGELEGAPEEFRRFNRCLRFETQVRMPVTVNGTPDLYVGMHDPSENDLVAVQVRAADADDLKYEALAVVSGTSDTVGGDRTWWTPVRAFPNHGEVWTVAIELRGPWVYVYVDGNLLGVLPMLWEPRQLRPYVRIDQGVSDFTASIDYMATRLHQPYLLRHPWGSEYSAGGGPPENRGDPGDYRLPGLPPPGGLWGEYFDDSELRQRYVIEAPADFQHEYLAALFSPIEEARFTRQDATLNFPASDPPAWGAVPTVGGDYWSARWTGAIYLDFDQADQRLELELGGTPPGTRIDRARLWVGRTMWGEQLVDTVVPWDADATLLTTGSLAEHLTTGAGPPVSGWYPIVLEYAHLEGTGHLRLRREAADAPGVWTVVPAADLSPVGVFDGETRFEPHSEMVKTIASTFGYQFVPEPRSLESQEFPCTVRPRVRVGRDTDRIVRSNEATELSRRVSAGETAEALLGDAQGLGRDDESQLTLERADWRRMAKAPFVRSEHESLSDISSAPLLEARMDSLLALRGGPWEEVSTTTAGLRELRDSFPLTGETREFQWAPGDGVRLVLEELDVQDATPRQIVAVPRPIVPGGLGEPKAKFRQRTRNLRQMLRRIQRLQAVRARHFQGQLTIVNGSLGVLPAPADPYSRVSVPRVVQNIVRATLVVQSKSGEGPHAVHVNGVQVATNVTKPGEVDITGDVLAALATSTERGVAVHMTGAGGETVRYAVELEVVI